MGIKEVAEAFSGKHPDARIGVCEDGPELLMCISGSFELHESYDLEGFLSLVIAETEPGRRLVIDLAKVSYMSSTGVGALINTLVSAHKKNVDVVFRRVPRKVISVLELLGLLSFFPMEEANA